MEMCEEIERLIYGAKSCKERLNGSKTVISVSKLQRGMLREAFLSSYIT